MYRSPRYPTDPAAVEAFVAGQRHGTLIATPPDGHPQISILPFVKRGQVDCIDPLDGGRATLNFRAAAYECEATVSTQPEAVATALRRLLETYEPGATYEPLADSDFYGPRLRRLAALQLSIVHADARFKVGPAAPPQDARQRVIRGLRRRSLPGDDRAADVIESFPGSS